MSPIESALLMFCTLAVTFQSQPFSALLYEYLAEHYSKPGAPMTVEEAWKKAKSTFNTLRSVFMNAQSNVLNNQPLELPSSLRWLHPKNFNSLGFYCLLVSDKILNILDSSFSINRQPYLMGYLESQILHGVESQRGKIKQEAITVEEDEIIKAKKTKTRKTVKQVQAEMDGSVATSSASASETSKKKKPAKPAAKKTTKKRKHESEEEGSDDDIVTKPKSKGKKQKSSRAKGKERDSDVEGSDAEPAEQEEGEEEEHESQPAPPAVNLGNGSEPISILHLAASVNAPPSNGKKKQATMDTYGSKK